MASRLRSERLLYGLVGFVALLVVWETTAQLGLYKKSLLSYPTAIWRVGIEDITSGVIWPHVQVSLEEFALGFIVSLAVAIPLGLLIGMFRRVDYTLNGLLAGLNAAPKAACIPLIILIVDLVGPSKDVLDVLRPHF